LAVSIIAVAEVYEGAFGIPGLRDFLSDFAILPVTDPIVEHLARMRAALRQQGQLIPDMDLLIGATAIAADLTLITRNVRHFARLPYLRLYQPS
jgi:tRNA(fMet)-specific endonuclease VapC